MTCRAAPHSCTTAELTVLVESFHALLATAAADLRQHLLAVGGVVAGSHREVFRRVAETGLVDANLGLRLARAAGMRNVLVHLDEQIDLEVARAAIGPALADFAALVAALEPLSREDPRTA